MARRVYRVCRSIHGRLDGFGAKSAGGRWNSEGYAVVYTAESLSLAVLENLVHLSREDFHVGYVCICASIPEDLAILEESNLRQAFPTLSTDKLGDVWIESLASAVLRVRSAVVFTEYNYLLNPVHPQFRKITVEEIAPFTFDNHLFRCAGVLRQRVCFFVSLELLGYSGSRSMMKRRKLLGLICFLTFGLAALPQANKSSDTAARKKGNDDPKNCSIDNNEKKIWERFLHIQNIHKSDYCDAPKDLKERYREWRRTHSG